MRSQRAAADVNVLEARNGITDTEQGYRININATGHDALRACLTAQQFTDYERTLHRQDDATVYLFSSALRLLSRSPMPPVPGAIDRGTLRRVLAEDLTDAVAAYHQDMRGSAGAALERSAGFAMQAHHIASAGLADAAHPRGDRV